MSPGMIYGMGWLVLIAGGALVIAFMIVAAADYFRWKP